MDRKNDAKRVFLINYKEIVKYLNFVDIMVLVSALDLYEYPCLYDTIEIENTEQFLFLSRHRKHFNYLHLFARQICSFDEKLTLNDGIKSLRIYKSLLLTGMPMLETFENLQQLVINRCDINRIVNLDNLRNLKVLNLTDNWITRIENLHGLSKLECLELSLNNISHIECLDGLLNLKTLDISYNCISRIQNLHMLTKLECLNLTSNRITTIDNLNALVNLKTLDLSYNKIKVHQNLDNLKNLTYLYLYGNLINFHTGQQ